MRDYNVLDRDAKENHPGNPNPEKPGKIHTWRKGGYNKKRYKSKEEEVTKKTK
jgi:hypothetical protein